MALEKIDIDLQIRLLNFAAGLVFASVPSHRCLNYFCYIVFSYIKMIRGGTRGGIGNDGSDLGEEKVQTRLMKNIC